MKQICFICGKKGEVKFYEKRDGYHAKYWVCEAHIKLYPFTDKILSKLDEVEA